MKTKYLLIIYTCLLCLISAMISILFYRFVFEEPKDDSYIVYYVVVENYPGQSTYDEIAPKSILEIFNSRAEALAYIKGVVNTEGANEISEDSPDSVMAALGILFQGESIEEFYYELPGEYHE